MGKRNKLKKNETTYPFNPTLMIDRKPWEEFRRTGLLLFINQILHVFGWAIVFEYDDKSQPPQLKEVYPARVKFRGFDEKSVGESYQSITNYLKENIEELKKETDE